MERGYGNAGRQSSPQETDQFSAHEQHDRLGHRGRRNPYSARTHIPLHRAPHVYEYRRASAEHHDAARAQHPISSRERLQPTKAVGACKGLAASSALSSALRNDVASARGRILDVLVAALLDLLVHLFPLLFRELLQGLAVGFLRVDLRLSGRREFRLATHDR